MIATLVEKIPNTRSLSLMTMMSVLAESTSITDHVPRPAAHGDWKQVELWTEAGSTVLCRGKTEIDLFFPEM